MHIMQSNLIIKSNLLPHLDMSYPFVIQLNVRFAFLTLYLWKEVEGKSTHKGLKNSFFLL